MNNAPLRDYQSLALEDLRQSMRKGSRCPILVAPPGAGKTRVAVEVVQSALDKGNSTLMLAPRRELVYQPSQVLLEQGIEHGLILAGEEPDGSAPVQVASWDTLRSWLKRDKIDHKDFGLIVVDECFRGDVEILTEKGFIRFDSLEDDARVAQVNGSGSIEFVFPSNYVTTPCKGQLLHLISNRKINLPLTPNHELITRYSGDYGKKPAHTLAGSWNMPTAAWSKSRTGRITPKQRLMIALQADGSIRKDTSVGKSLDFHLTKQRKINQLHDICRSGGFILNEVKGTKNKRRFLIHRLGYVSKDVREFFPLKGLTQGTAKAIIEEVVEWDGHKNSETGYYFSSTTEAITDFYQAICVIAGYGTSKSIQHDDRKETNSDVFRLFITKNKNEISGQGINKTYKEFWGYVYCVRVPSGKIIIRSNGRTLITGNCHLMTPKRANLLRQNWPNVRIIGLTATPARQQGASLGKWFDDLVYGPSMRELIDRGYLLEPEYYVPSTPDKSRMKLIGGDYSAESVARVLGDSAIIGDVVSHWCRLGAGRSTVLFAATVAHATHFRDAFLAVGAKAVVLHGGTPLTERMDIIRRVNEGEIDVLCTVSVVDVGWDAPQISCAIIARTTRSVVRYLQTTGRILRPCEGQDRALILDHAGVVDELGLIDEDRPWSLEAEGKVQDRDTKRRQKSESADRVCKNCGYVFQASDCPKCGWVPPTRSKAPNVVEGELHKLNGEPRKWGRDARRRFFGELLGAAIKMGYKRGWAVPAYKSKLKTLPWEDGAYRGVHPLEPSPEVMGFARHLRIRRAKAYKRYSNNGG